MVHWKFEEVGRGGSSERRPERMLTRGEWAILVLVILYSFVPSFGGLIRVVELAGGPAIAPENPRALADPAPIVLHVLGSFVFCIFGAVQFLPSVRRRRPATHRALGRAVAVGGIVSAATGLWMTFAYAFPEALQGDLLFWARIVLGLSMVALIVGAVTAIRARDVVRHRAAMARAYAIGQGASTQSAFGIGWILAFEVEPTGLVRDGLMVSAWGVNLLVAELLLAKPLKLSSSSSVR